jgi:hypothetical protein
VDDNKGRVGDLINNLLNRTNLIKEKILALDGWQRRKEEEMVYMDAFQRLEARFEGMEEVIASLTRKVGELEERVCHCNDSTESSSSSNGRFADVEQESEAVRELREARGLSGPVAMVSDPETGASVPVEIGDEDLFDRAVDRAEPLPVAVRSPAIPVSRQRAIRRSGPISNLGPTRIGRKSCRTQREAVDEYFDVAPRFRRTADMDFFRETRRKLICAARQKGRRIIADPGTESSDGASLSGVSSESGDSRHGVDASAVEGSIRTDRSVYLDSGEAPKPNGVGPEYRRSSSSSFQDSDPGPVPCGTGGGDIPPPLLYKWGGPIYSWRRAVDRACDDRSSPEV